MCILCSIADRLDAQDTAQFFRLLNSDFYVQEQVTANSEFVLSVLHQFRPSFEKCFMLDQTMNSLNQEKAGTLTVSVFVAVSKLYAEASHGGKTKTFLHQIL